jgi:hypothetical protein
MLHPVQVRAESTLNFLRRNYAFTRMELDKDECKGITSPSRHRNKEIFRDKRFDWVLPTRYCLTSCMPS